jgi:L-2-hydroxyglutarate oxidase LhgO
MGQMSERFDVVVIGGGIVGLSTARRLLERRPALRLAVLEKESELAAHQSGHNSGVLHSGLYYRPGSLKARLCREGKAEVERFADEHGIPYEHRGKVVVALDESELPRLAELERRGAENRVEGLRAISGDELRELEPHVAGIRALHSPTTGVIDFRQVAAAYGDEVQARGGTIITGREVTAVCMRGGERELVTTGGPVATRNMIACAGLQADRVAALTGDAPRDHRIVPFRGDYYTFRSEARHLVNGLVYPVPDPSFPFLGVHFTRQIDGGVVAGPNAVLALAREGYGRVDVRMRDVADVLAWPGFWRLAARNLRMGAAEVWRDAVKLAFVHDMQRLLPAARAADVEFGPSGVRGQALARDGSLADDFLLAGSPNVLHVLNAPSPAATASPAIGRYLAEQALERFFPGETLG